jgi:hypothetical protein
MRATVLPFRILPGGSLSRLLPKATLESNGVAARVRQERSKRNNSIRLRAKIWV